MAALKFRVYFEEDEAIYRDIVILHKQTFFQLHLAILKAYEFDMKHQAMFYRSNDQWARGREITLELYNDFDYKATPLLMEETMVGKEILDPNQRFLYVYDFDKKWTFLIELININKEEDSSKNYPYISRTEGLAPLQYGIKSILGEKFADIEEKYDLKENEELFGDGLENNPSEDFDND